MLVGETMLNIESRSAEAWTVGILLGTVLIGGMLMLVRLRRELEG